MMEIAYPASGGSFPLSSILGCLVLYKTQNDDCEEDPEHPPFLLPLFRPVYGFLSPLISC